eukprot:m.169308 g.169308  ORF g.169308 m.169308 type:complete len:430 (-) comp53220_c0_seq4:169-1458(-)
MLWSVALLLASAAALDNGVARTPPMGWSTWNTFRYAVSSELIMSSADVVVSSGLLSAGYKYVLIDDGWPACAVYTADGGCAQPAPRDANNQIQVNTTKFPGGFQPLTEYVHSKGLLIGIYTAVSNTTCGGFTGSLNYEAIDAASFAEWGFDFVKFDTCGYDCGVHDLCMQNSTARMRDGLNATGRPIVFYIDAGNPTSPQRIYNPFAVSVPPQQMIKVANTVEQLVWYWGPTTANMWKHWFDISDHWVSTLDNLQNMIKTEMYQSCGAYNTPDMLTVGQGGQSEGQYRAQFFLWALLGAPLIIGCDVRAMDNFTQTLLTSTEIIAIDQDPSCVQGSIAHSRDGTEVWIKPLSDQTFAVVLFNKNPFPALVTLFISPNNFNLGDFYPAEFYAAKIRNVYTQTDVGWFPDLYAETVPAYDAVILKVTPDLG